MKVTCPGCGWSAEVPEEKIPVSGGKASCPKCKVTFSVKRGSVLSAIEEFAIEENKVLCSKCGLQATNKPLEPSESNEIKPKTHIEINTKIHDVVLDDNIVTIIQKSGFLTKRSENAISISSITSVVTSKPGLLPGDIQFIVGGEVRDLVNYSKLNEVSLFDDKQYQNALLMKKYIEEYSRSDTKQNNAVSVTDEILKFKKLFDDGVLTEVEFSAKKKQLLNL